MSIIDYIIKLGDQGIKLNLIDDQLKINAPNNLLIDDLINELKQKKNDIVKEIKKSNNCSNCFIPKRDAAEYYDVSSSEARMFFAQQIISNEVSYNVSELYTLNSKFDLDNLTRTFNELIARHEILRSTFVLRDQKLVKRIHKSYPFTIECKSITIDSLQQCVNNLIKPFDLSELPLFNIKVLNCEGQFFLFVDMHHIITDAVSNEIFIAEINSLYSKEKLPPLSINYSDYAFWQNKYKQTIDYRRQELFWLDEFKDLPSPTALPYDFEKNSSSDLTGNTIKFYINSIRKEQITKFAHNNNLTIFSLVFGVFNLFLRRLTSQNEIIVGTPIILRNHQETGSLLGNFQNTLALRCLIDPNYSIEEFLKSYNQKLIQVFENKSYPFEDLINALEIERDLLRHPLFDIMLSYQTIENDLNNDNLIQDQGKYNFLNNTSKFDLSLHCIDNEKEIECSVEYKDKLFSAETIKLWIEYFQYVLDQVIKYPFMKVSEIGLLPETAKNNIILEFNNTEYKYSSKSEILFDLIDRQFISSPNNRCIQINEKTLNYSDLSSKSEQLATKLLNKGFQKDTIIAILLDRSPEMLIGIYAILKAGCAYLPIDPDYPKERISFILKDSGCKLILTASTNYINVGYPCEVINISDSDIYKTGQKNNSLNTHIQPTDLAYVIYTSGTTGSPKGVMIEHRALDNCIQWMQRKYPINKSDVILLKTPFSFDVSVTELFWWATVGASVCILESSAEKDPALITDAIEKYKVTIINFVPSMLNVFLDYIKETNSIHRVKSLKRVFAAGEELTLQQVNLFNVLLYKNNNTLLFNLYGPTEATIYASSFDCLPSNNLKNIPIGKPIDNVKLFIIDDNLNLQPIGIPGELCISGNGLARGYLKRPELTNDKFVSNPFIKEEKLYKTGDLAKWLPDGNIEYLGRIDNQVKIRGNRIELGEIRAKINEYKEVKDSVVIAKVDDKENKYLVAYYISKTKENVLPENLSSFLKEFLPDYMLPSFYEKIDHIPLSANGKIDIQALPILNIKPDEDKCIEPRNFIEEQILEIWSKFLPIKRINMHDNFFRLGGHSLTGVQVITRINNEFNIQMKLNMLFNSPTIDELAKVVAKMKKHEKREEYEFGRI